MCYVFCKTMDQYIVSRHLGKYGYSLAFYDTIWAYLVVVIVGPT